MRRDPTEAYALFEKAAELSRRTLARYEERAPATLEPLFAALAADLFKPGLSLEAVLEDAGSRRGASSAKSGWRWRRGCW